MGLSSSAVLEEVHLDYALTSSQQPGPREILRGLSPPTVLKYWYLTRVQNKHSPTHLFPSASLSRPVGGGRAAARYGRIVLYCTLHTVTTMRGGSEKRPTTRIAGEALTPRLYDKVQGLCSASLATRSCPVKNSVARISYINTMRC
jgi:hypothetical protein